jgi:hypothetical protein
MKLLKYLKKKDFKEGSFYVVNKGGYGGDYLVLMKHEISKLKFLVLPDLEKREIEEDVFKRGLEIEAVKFLEVLPNSVFKACKLQFDKINNSYELCTTDKNN